MNSLLGEQLDIPVEALGPRGENFVQTYQTEWGIVQFHLGVPGIPKFQEAIAAVALVLVGLLSAALGWFLKPVSEPTEIAEVRRTPKRYSMALDMEGELADEWFGCSFVARRSDDGDHFPRGGLEICRWFRWSDDRVGSQRHHVCSL